LLLLLTEVGGAVMHILMRKFWLKFSMMNLKGVIFLLKILQWIGDVVFLANYIV